MKSANDNLKKKHKKLLANKAISAISSAIECNTDMPTDEGQYLKKAKSNISLLKGRIKSIIQKSTTIRLEP